MIGGLFRRSLFKLDLGMEGKTVFCNLIKNVISSDNIMHTITVTPGKIHTAHLIYNYEGIGNIVSTFSTGSSGNSYCNSYDIVLVINKVVYIANSYYSIISNKDGGFGGYNSVCGIEYDGSYIGLCYHDALDDDEGQILLIIKEHDVIM